METRIFSNCSRVGLSTGTLASLDRGATQYHIRNQLPSMREIGVSVIDTDDSSTSGRCETLIGAALQCRRNDFVVVTKDFPHPAQYALRSTALLTLRSSATLPRLSEAGPHSHFRTFPHSHCF